MNVRGLQWNHLCFTSFREVSWGYERFAQQCTQWNFSGGPVRHGQFPQKQWIASKRCYSQGISGTRDPSQNWVTNSYEDLRTPTKTHENSNLFSDPLTFMTSSWLLVTLRNPMKTLWGTLHDSFTGLNHWFCYFVKVCDWWPRVMKGQDCSRRLTKAHENIWKPKIGIWKFMMANVGLFSAHQSASSFPAFPWPRVGPMGPGSLKKFMTLFIEMKYLARQTWNLQTLKPPDTNSWVVPSTCLKFRNRDSCCTIHRNKPRLQYISSIRIHGKSSELFSS